MKAVILEQFNDGYGDLVLADIDMPTPQDGDVLIKVETGGVFPADLLSLSNKYVYKRTPPFVAGLFAVGTIVGEKHPMAGMRVFFIPGPERPGTWAEYSVADAAACIPVGELEPEVAMNMGNSVTAIALLATVKRHGAQAAVVNAAAGALGKILNVQALMNGVSLINIVRSDGQAEILRDLGALHILDQTAPDFEEQLRSKAAELNATVALDSIAGTAPQQLIKLLPVGSTIITLGNLSGEDVVLNPVEIMMARQARFEVFEVSQWMGAQDQDTLMSCIGAAAELSAKVGAKTSIRNAYSLTDTIRNIEAISRNRSAGMTLVYPHQEG